MLIITFGQKYYKNQKVLPKFNLNISNKISFYRVLLLIFFGVLAVFKLFSLYTVSLDSDEVMWSVMANNIVTFQKQYLYFADQNFRGSLEAYLLSPFQLLFGVSVFSLRVNSLIFNFLTAVFIYKSMLLMLPEKSKSVVLFSLLAVLTYFLQLPNNLVVHTKSWGNYNFIEFACVFSYYFFFKYIVSAKTPKTINLIGLGVILGISFWANMQALYFIVVLFMFTFVLDVPDFIRNLISLTKNKLLFSILAFNLVTIFFNLYLLAKKRSLFNPFLTLNNKLNFNFNSEILSRFNIPSLWFIYLMWGCFIIYLTYSVKTKNTIFKKFFYLVNFSFIGIFINIYHNSLSRVSAEGGDVLTTFNFLINVVFRSFYQNLFYVVILLSLIGLFFRFKVFIKLRRLSLDLYDLYLASFFVFLVMFLVSSIPQLTPTPRYLIIWWPVSVIAVYATISKIFVKDSVKIFFSLLFFSLYFFIWFKGIPFIRSSQKTYVDQKQVYSAKSKLITDSGYTTCVGNYWNVGPVMFYSNLKIKCWSEGRYGTSNSYLNDYKAKFSNTAPFVVN
ncbi:hypothetical protein GW755_03350 [bacterium]|nr:hypothetical protein [bacterium]